FDRGRKGKSVPYTPSFNSVILSYLSVFLVFSLFASLDYLHYKSVQSVFMGKINRNNDYEIRAIRYNTDVDPAYLLDMFKGMKSEYGNFREVQRNRSLKLFVRNKKTGNWIRVILYYRGNRKNVWYVYSLNGSNEYKNGMSNYGNVAYIGKIHDKENKLNGHK
ncbi:hypothetical protein, partial [Vibrio penaeicida]